jgi:hypothetical protein
MHEAWSPRTAGPLPLARNLLTTPDACPSVLTVLGQRSARPVRVSGVEGKRESAAVQSRRPKLA